MRWTIASALFFPMFVTTSIVHAGDACCMPGSKSTASVSGSSQAASQSNAACNYSKKEKKTTATTYQPPVWR